MMKALCPWLSFHATRWFTLILILCTTGCYECRWSAAGKAITPADSIAGRWSGTWQSDANGHDGGLRCIISDVTADTFKADFKASYGWLFTFTYTATMRITGRAPCPDTQPAIDPMYVYFKGAQDLGWLAGGMYHYDGKVGPTAFFCNYKSGSDHGRFQLTRPGGAVAD